MTQKEAIEQEKGTLNAVKEWLLGRGDTPPAPTRIYRGILKGNVPTASPEGEYMAGSPWPQIAGRGGKGAMGDYRSHNLHSYPAGEDTLYYRGGALAGDPLEQTLINSASGMTWNQLLERAKEAYPKLVAKEMKNLKRDLPDPEMQKLWSEEIPSNVADRITSALRMASFETDVFGKPGIWAGKELPKKLAGETPKLRSYKELERVVAKARKAGMSEEDIAQLPESQILARRMDKNPTPGPLGVDVASEVEGPKSLGAMALDSEEFLAAVRRRNVEKDGSIWQHGQRVRPTDENIAINIASAERNMAEKQVIIDNLSKLPVDADVTTVRKYLANDTRIVTRDEGIAIFSGLNRQSAKYIEDMKLANATEKSRKESGLLGLIPAFLVGAAGIGAAILGPSDAEAGVIDGAMGTVSKSVFNWLKTARGLGTEIEPLIKTVDAMHLNAVPVNPANPYTAPRAMEGLSLAPAATQALGATKEAIARTSKFFLGLNRFMTPYTVGEIYYKPGFNPAVELASRQEAWMKNTSIRGQVAANILDAVPGYRASQAEGRKAIIDAFEPLAKRHAEDVGVYRTLEMREATLGEYLTAMGKKKNPGEKIRNGIAKAQEELESIAITKKQLQPNVQEFQAETTAMYDRLSKQYPGVRLSLAAEDTADFQHYPFLKGRLSFDERTAVARIKDLMLDYGQRIKDAKLDTITERPFIHHGWHPAWSEANVAKRLADLDLSMANALPYSKFFRRSQYSMQMVPEVAYNLERYIPDAEKRIQMAKFWDKGNPSGWWRHASSTQVQGSEPLRNFWQLIRDSAVPSTVTTGNQWMNRYAMFESLRLIGYAPSVAFKHLFKQMGTFSSLGVRETLSTAPVSGGVALRNYLRQNVHPDVLRSIGLVGDRDVNKGLDEFVNSFVRQNRMQNILQDLDLRPYGNSVPDQVLNRLATNSGLLVGMVESFDRANSVMASILMAQKAGMTGQQAVYSIYDTILKNNFLGGVMNASWMKDPWIRGLFLFQSTPFKIAERRLVQAYKTGKSLGKVWDVIPGANALQKLEQLAGVKNFVKQGEDEFKKKMILGALTSEKDTFGTPVSKQFMKEMVMAGLVLGAGGAMGLDLSPQVGHFPFLKPTSHDPALSVSPILSSAFQVMGDRGKAAREGEDPQFFVTNFLQNWIGGEGYVPLTAHKLMRISNDDVPETYKGSGLQYLFSVPSKKGQ